jgi:hypothetical protein
VIDERVFRPDVLPKIFPSHDLLGVLQQDTQDLERLTRDFLAESGLADLTGLEIDLEYPELNLQSRRGGSTRSARQSHKNIPHVCTRFSPCTEGTCLSCIHRIRSLRGNQQTTGLVLELRSPGARSCIGWDVKTACIQACWRE